MPHFRYRAFGARGEITEGSIDAISEVAASDCLWAQGLTPFELRAADQSARRWWQREVLSSGGAVQAHLTSFTRDFATLIEAGIALDDALRMVADQATSPKIAALSKDLLADVLNGSPLSDALHRHPQFFAAEYVSAVRAGEISGNIAQVFVELADLLERRLEIRARLRSAFVYPCVLVMLALASLAIIISVLVPSIAPVFAESGRPMPAMLGYAVLVQSQWLQVLTRTAVVAGSAILLAMIVLRRPGIRMALDRQILKSPFVGAFLLQRETARFARTLGTLLRAGVSLLQAAVSARSVIGNRHIGCGMDRAIEAIREGVPLHRALQSETSLPPVAVRIIAVGEEAGKLDRMLIRVAVTYEQQTQRSVDRFMTLLTPVLTLVIAAVVGSLIFAVMNAILSLNDLALQ